MERAGLLLSLPEVDEMVRMAPSLFFFGEVVRMAPSLFFFGEVVRWLVV